MRFDPPIPSFATHIVHDLNAFKRDPVPVADFEPFDVPDDSYVEYGFVDADGAFRADPTNDEAHNQWYDWARGVFGADYQASPYNFGKGPDTAIGELTRHRLESAILGQTRRALIYTPLGYDDQALPTILVQDGLGFLHYARVPMVLDALIADGKIPPARAVLVPPIDRDVEYPHNEAYQRFFLEELLPWADDAAINDGRRILLGASLGGLVSTLIAWQQPELFESVALLSGAFLTSPDNPREHYRGRGWFAEQVRSQPKKPLRFHLFAGTLEWLTDANRDLVQALTDKGYEPTYFERNVGHNWVGWRDAVGPLITNALA